MEDTKKIFFICDGDVPECEKTECYQCGGECKWTSDVRHAVNFKDLFDYGVYFEKDRGTEEPRPCFSRDEKKSKTFRSGGSRQALPDREGSGCNGR